MLQETEQTLQSPQEEEGHQQGLGRKREGVNQRRLREELIPETGSYVGKKKWGEKH